MSKSIIQKIASMTHEVVDSYIEEFKKSNRQIVKPAIMRHTWGRDLEKEWSEYGFKPKLTTLTDNHKLLIYLKDPIVAAIIQTRITQLTEFAIPQKDQGRPGFRIEKKDGSKATSEEENEVNELVNFILNCGIVDDERCEADELLNFETFLKLTCKDSLIYDGFAVEIIPDNEGKLHHFLPVSGATMRLLAPNFKDTSLHESEMYEQLTKPIDSDLLKRGKYKYGQVTNGQLRKVYTSDEVLFEFRNPINDFFTNGYPISELDLLANIISAHINADKYNWSIYTHGTTSENIINLKGEVDAEQLKAFRRSYYAQGIGPDAMLKTPVINVPEGLEVVKLSSTHKDLEYSNYITYLIKVICAVFQIAPEEIGFDTGGKSDGSSGNSQNYNNVEKKLEYSRDKGLTPLLRFVQTIINEKILPKFDKNLYDKYKFRFVGIDEESPEQENGRLELETKFVKTINEARKDKGLPEIEGGNVIRDSIWMQWYSQYSEKAKQMNQEMEAQAGPEMGGDEGASGGGIEYVDEQGNPVDPADIDPDTMSFEDEDGNKTDHEGNQIGADVEPEGNADEEKLPFESEEPEEEALPFEANAGAEEKSKLPFE